MMTMITIQVMILPYVCNNVCEENCGNDDNEDADADAVATANDEDDDEMIMSVNRVVCRLLNVTATC